MKLKQVKAAIAVVSGLLLGNSHVDRVHADKKACSTKTLHGSYGLYRSGTTSIGPLTAVRHYFLRRKRKQYCDSDHQQEWSLHS